MKRIFRIATGLACAAYLGHAPALAEDVLLERFAELRATDDLDGMDRRRFLRALVVPSKTFYFIDRGRARGMVAEALVQFEGHLNARLGHTRPQDRVHVVAVPVSREDLIPWLLEGRGDLAAANLTITPEREAKVDFSLPFYAQAREVLVTAPGIPVPQRLADLSGHEIFVRQSSSYYQNLIKMNRASWQAKRRPAVLRPADERLEDEDLAEMVNAGLIPRIVMDDYKAALWAKVLPEIRVHEHIAVHEGGRIAWAFRRDSPKLKAAVDGFVQKHKIGTAFGNDAYRRYLVSTRWVKKATSQAEMAKFRATVELFRKYGRQYRFDYLMIAALGYQESGLDQSRRSPRGAVGVMQVLPSTGRLMQVGDVRKLEPNIHAGTKYLRELADRHFPDAEIDDLNRTLLSFAAYNAGPTRVAQLRREAEKTGLDPDQWFNHVEHVAARRVGREPVQYVAGIYKYYIAYKLVEQQERERQQLRAEP